MPSVKNPDSPFPRGFTFPNRDPAAPAARAARGDNCPLCKLTAVPVTSQAVGVLRGLS